MSEKKIKLLVKPTMYAKSKSDPLGHAEIVAIKKAAKKKLRIIDLTICILFTTLEPCLMCASIILNARFKKIIFFY